MRVYYTAVPAQNSAEAERALNQFLASHRIAKLEQRLVEDGPDSYWAVVVSYYEGGASAPTKKSNVDYSQVLSPADFAVYSAIRDWRRKISDAEKMPLYAVMTNEQMAELAVQRPATLAEMGQIDGWGKGRLEKYGAAILEILLAHPKAVPDET